jgi:hypothetical protein
MGAKTFMHMAFSVYDNLSDRNLSGHSMCGLTTIREVMLLLWVLGWSNTIAGVLIALTGTNHSFLSLHAVFKMRLVVQICTADVLAAVGMFDVTMVTGSALVGVTTAYSPSPPVKPVISCQMSSTPFLYLSDISIGFCPLCEMNEVGHQSLVTDSQAQV